MPDDLAGSTHSTHSTHSTVPVLHGLFGLEGACFNTVVTRWTSGLSVKCVWLHRCMALLYTSMVLSMAVGLLLTDLTTAACHAPVVATAVVVPTVIRDKARGIV